MKDKLRFLGKLLFHYVVSPVVPHLPFAVVWRLGVVLGRLNHLLNSGLRERIRSNLRLALPDEPEDRIRALCRGNFVHHAIHSLEILYLPSVDGRFMDRYVTMSGQQHVQEALEKGKGIIFVLGHFGSYYLSGVAMQVHGVVMNDIAQDVSQLDLGWLERKILDRRLGNYQGRIRGRVFHKGNVLAGVIRALRKNEAVSLFIDALTQERDPVVDFLGSRMRTPQGPPRIAAKTGSALIFAAAARRPGGGMNLSLQPVPLVSTGDREQDLQVNAQRCMELLDQAVRGQPEQWLLWRIYDERRVA